MYQTVFIGREARQMASRQPRRQPILEAMIRVVGCQGYPATSVGDVVAEAHASRATFYKYFDDKRDCFLVAYELVIERVLAAALAGCKRAGPWPAPAQGGLAAIVDLFTKNPTLARTAMVEVAAAGDEARRRHGAALGQLGGLLDEARGRRQPQLPPNTALMAVSGVAALILDELRAGRTADLPSLLPELEFALLVPFIGPREAATQLRRGATQARSGASNL